ncbi:MAG: 50S ribosomal protein L30 [Actinomycetota bacterium]
MSKVKVTLVRGLPGTTKRQRATVEALGLRKVSSSAVHDDTPSFRGQVAKVSHLVKVEEEA